MEKLIRKRVSTAEYKRAVEIRNNKTYSKELQAAAEDVASGWSTNQYALKTNISKVNSIFTDFIMGWKIDFKD